jgi:hypothetical protein
MTEKPKKRYKCPHGRDRYRCKECGGVGICPHGRVRAACTECRGQEICEHGMRRTLCKQCEGGGRCVHDRRRDACPICRPRAAYAQYVGNDRRKYGTLPKDFMSFEIYSGLIERNCTWCRRTPLVVGGMGIDRRDNSLGHVAGNIEPCCRRCNWRRGTATWEDFGAYLLDMGLIYGRQEETYE